MVQEEAYAQEHTKHTGGDQGSLGKCATCHPCMNSSPCHMSVGWVVLPQFYTWGNSPGSRGAGASLEVTGLVSGGGKV